METLPEDSLSLEAQEIPLPDEGTNFSPNNLALPPNSTELKELNLSEISQITQELNIAKNTIQIYKKWVLYLSLSFLLVMISIIIIIIYAQHKEDLFSKTTKKEAISIESNVLKQLVNGSDITDHFDELRQSFNSFDDDNDGAWSAEELAGYLKTATSADDVFNIIDVDNDDILSFREVVAYLIAIDSVPITSDIIQFSYDYNIKHLYNYTLDSSNDTLWYEYAANIFFNTFSDAPLKGYISSEMFYGFYAEHHMDNFDFDGDGVINFDEFIWDFFDDQLLDLFRYIDLESFYTQDPNEYQDSLQWILNEDSIMDLELTISPELITRHIKPAVFVRNRRRLGRREPRTPEYKLLGDDYKNYSAFYYIYDLPDAFLQTGARYCYITPHPEHDCAYWESQTLGSCCPVSPQQCISCIAAVPKECYECWKAGCYSDSPSIDDPHDAPCFFQPEKGGDEKGGQQGSTVQMGCFAGWNKIFVNRSDDICEIRLDALQIGDYVLSKHNEWTKVWWIDTHYGSYDMYNIYFNDDDYISLTPHHLLYIGVKEEKAMKRADQVEIGDIVFIMKDNGDIFEAKKVVYIGFSIETNAYNPVTMDGSVVVNNVLSSCYTRSVGYAQRLHESAAILRAISKVNTNLAAILTDFFYNVIFKTMRLFHLDFVLNAYSSGCIVVGFIMIVSTTSISFLI